MPVEDHPDRVKRTVLLVRDEYIADGGQGIDPVDVGVIDVGDGLHHEARRFLLGVTGVELDHQVGAVLRVRGPLVD